MPPPVLPEAAAAHWEAKYTGLRQDHVSYTTEWEDRCERIIQLMRDNSVDAGVIAQAEAIKAESIVR